MPVAVQDSSALGALAGADALLLRPAGAAAVAKGDVVQIMPFAPRYRS